MRKYLVVLVLAVFVLLSAGCYRQAAPDAPPAVVETVEVPFEVTRIVERVIEVPAEVPAEVPEEEPAEESVEEPAEEPEEEPEVVDAKEVVTDTTTSEGVWRVRLNQDISFGPELGLSRPGYGTGSNEIGVAVGVTLTALIDGEETVLGGGCQQVMLLPEAYAKDWGGADWGYRGYVFNPEETQWQDELVVLAHEWAMQQIQDEGCPELEEDELLHHVHVAWADEDGNLHLQKWTEFRRPSGEDNVIMVHPSDKMAVGWHCGFEEGSQDDIADDGACFISDANFWLRLGGGVVHPWEGEVPDGLDPITGEELEELYNELH